MKKFTLFVLGTLMLTFPGFSQMKQVSMKDLGTPATMKRALRHNGNNALMKLMSQPNMMRSNGVLDYTIYDWQSNCGPRTWTHCWDDYKVNFAYTISNDSILSDHGTGIGTYDFENDTWIPLGGRIEEEATDFGSMARFGANGLVIAAHTATECGIYIVDDKDNMTPESAITLGKLDNTNGPCWPSVMTSGTNHDIIHVVATASDNHLPGMEGVTDPIIYFRSTDGGETWDKENVILPFMGPEDAIAWTPNCCHWMETDEDNCLALVVNNAWSDGMVIFSYDDGETWDRVVFYDHPNPFGDFSGTWFFYPRWVSAQWDNNHKLNIVYEFNATTGTPGSDFYYPNLGGVAFWYETMPYHGCDTTVNYHEVGQPFVMDSAYLYHDIYGSWWQFSDRSHAMWPEYIGPLVTLTDDGDPEDVEAMMFDMYEPTLNINNLSLHGNYNCGICAMPVLCTVLGTDYLVAVWSMMDENHIDENGNYLFKLYMRVYGGNYWNWSNMIALSKATALSSLELVYSQAAVVGSTLVIAAQADKTAGTYVQNEDNNINDNFYQGLTLNLNNVFFSYTWYDIYADPIPSEGGTITGAGSYMSGSICVLQAKANEGYVFDCWTKNGETVSTNPNYAFAVAHNDRCYAHFINDPDDVKELPSPCVKAYPNPAKDKMMVEGASMRHITVFDLTGVAVLNKDVNGNQASVDLKGIHPGTYILGVMRENGRIVYSKLVIAP